MDVVFMSACFGGDGDDDSIVGRARASQKTRAR